jgi:competence protein ComEA
MPDPAPRAAPYRDHDLDPDPVDPPVPARPLLVGSRAVLVDRMRARWEDPRVRTLVLLVAAAVAGFAWFQLGRAAEPGRADPPSVARRAGAGPRAEGAGQEGAGREGAGREGARPTAVGGGTPTGATGDAGGTLVVHVAGAVARPGVVRVRAGARVVDAIEAAGGARPDAALDQLNLAAKVVDGQRIAVAKVGEAAPPLVDGTDGGGGSDPGGGGGSGGPVNLNTATQTQLEALPGIGPALAGAILRYRDEHGRFRSVGQLREVRGIGDGRFADLEGLVTV